ncbi:MAG: peptide-methionine (S)-S-oxide reductase MsrA [Gammaproteobacteria bacterium]
MKRLFSALFIICTLSALTSCAQRTSQKDVAKNVDLSKYQKATFASGCFWHEEALFESVKGVAEAISGYAGGTTANPDYESIESGNTGYAETVQVYYDPSVISYATLLKVYFEGQDPTSVNGQAPDFGTQYRSIAFYTNDAEKNEINNYIAQLKASKRFDKPIAVQVMPLKKFWVAEDYHQNYVALNPNSGYVRNVSIPEIKKFQKEFPQLIKPGHFF